jgi:hypothetical protein
MNVRHNIVRKKTNKMKTEIGSESERGETERK